MEKQYYGLDLNVVSLKALDTLRVSLYDNFIIEELLGYMEERGAEMGPSTNNILMLPDLKGDEIIINDFIPDNTFLVNYKKFIEMANNLPYEEETIPEVLQPPICGAEAKPDPDWILDTISYNSNYIKNMVKFFQGSGIKCEYYQEGNPYLIWNGYEAYFTPGFEEGCVAKTASDFVKDVMYTKLWPQIEAHLLGKPLESEQQHQVQPKQATLMDLARHMVIESQNQGIELGIGEDGLFTFKVLIPQQNEMNNEQ